MHATTRHPAVRGILTGLAIGMVTILGGLAGFAIASLGAGDPADATPITATVTTTTAPVDGMAAAIISVNGTQAFLPGNHIAGQDVQVYLQRDGQYSTENPIARNNKMNAIAGAALAFAAAAWACLGVYEARIRRAARERFAVAA